MLLAGSNITRKPVIDCSVTQTQMHSSNILKWKPQLQTEASKANGSQPIWTEQEPNGFTKNSQYKGKDELLNVESSSSASTTLHLYSWQKQTKNSHMAVIPIGKSIHLHQTWRKMYILFCSVSLFPLVGLSLVVVMVVQFPCSSIPVKF